MDDQRQIEAVLAGDPEAFGPLMDRYYAMVYRVCLNMAGNVPDAEELLADLTRATAAVVSGGPRDLRPQAIRVMGCLRARDYTDLQRERFGVLCYPQPLPCTH